LKQGVHPKIVQERLGHSSISTTLDIYSHLLPGMDEAAARRFEEGLQVAADDISIENVAKLACKGGFKVEFEARRGVRVVYGAALEKRSPLIVERGFESHPLRQEVFC